MLQELKSLQWSKIHLTPKFELSNNVQAHQAFHLEWPMLYQMAQLQHRQTKESKVSWKMKNKTRGGKSFSWTNANFSHDSKEFKIKEQQLVDTRKYTRVWWCQVWIWCQIWNDRVGISYVETVVVKCWNLMQRIKTEELTRSMLVLIKIDIFQLKMFSKSFYSSYTIHNHSYHNIQM